jgi:hypothetical protein
MDMILDSISRIPLTFSALLLRLKPVSDPWGKMDFAENLRQKPFFENSEASRW